MAKHYYTKHELEETDVSVTVFCLQGKNAGQYLNVRTTLNDLIQDGLPERLIELGVFEFMGHPHEYYTIKSLTIV